MQGYFYSIQYYTYTVYNTVYILYTVYNTVCILYTVYNTYTVYATLVLSEFRRGSQTLPGTRVTGGC